MLTSRIFVHKNLVRLIIFSILLVALIYQHPIFGSDNSLIPDSVGSISGKVISEGGVQLEGIEVTLYLMTRYYLPDPLRTTKTDSEGAYRFNVLIPGTYILKFDDPDQNYAFEFYTGANYWQAAERVRVAGTDVNNIDIELVKGSVITGTITGGVPAEHFIRLSHQVEGRWESVHFYKHENPDNIQGIPKYALRGLPSGIYRIYASADYYGEYYDNVRNCDVEDCTDLSVTAGEIISNINIVLGDAPGFGHISGIVTNANNEPLPDIDVYSSLSTTSGPRTVTDKEGRYFIASYRAEKYSLRFVDPSGKYVNKYYPGVIKAEDRTIIELEEKQQLDNIDMVLDLAAYITGTITLRGETKGYSSGCVIASRKTEDQGWFDSDFCSLHTNTAYSFPIDVDTGMYTMDGLPAGEYRLFSILLLEGYRILYVDREAYSIGRLKEYYHEADTITDTVTMTLSAGDIITGINLNLGEDEFSSTIQGTVIADDIPLSGAIVEIMNMNDLPLLSVHADSNGNYRFDNLLSGLYQLRARDPQFTFAPRYFGDTILSKDARLINVEKNETLSDIDIKLVQGGKISGTIVHLDGEPASWLTVEAEFLEPSEPTAITVMETMTSQSGSYSFQSLNPGFYHIYIYDGRSYNSFKEYYGCDRGSCKATKLRVQEGMIISNIDFIYGREKRMYLPFMSR